MSHPDSGEATVTAANGNTPQTAFDARDDALFRVEQIIVEYDPAATATTELTIHDDPDGTAAADLDETRKTIKNLQPGDVRSYDRLRMRTFDQDVLVQADGNQDDDVVVYVDGEVITSQE